VCIHFYQRKTPHCFISSLAIVISNILVISSCELLEYDGGSIGLYYYGVASEEECFSYDGMEDDTMKTARMGSMLALGFGVAFFALNLIHHFFQRLPFEDVLFAVVGSCVQLCLSLVYLAWKNEVCETFGCGMGDGASWNGLAHFMYLVSLIISLGLSDPYIEQALKSSGSPVARKHKHMLELK
jgi:hypothetical protein